MLRETVAFELLASYCAKQDIKLLKSLYRQFQQYQQLATLLVKEAYSQQGN